MAAKTESGDRCERSPGYVYFITVGNPPTVKVGISTKRDITRRLSTLQCGNHEPLTLLGVIPFEGTERPMLQAAKREAELHAQFAQLQRFRKGWAGSEWFTASAELLEVVRSTATPSDRGLPSTLAKMGPGRQDTAEQWAEERTRHGQDGAAPPIAVLDASEKEAMVLSKTEKQRAGRVEMKAMTLEKRLELIVEAVKYCQRVKTLGMPPWCYSKALREPVYFLWECREGGKHHPAFRSKGAVGLTFGRREIVYDHAVPFKYVQQALLLLSEVTAETVSSTLTGFGTSVLITREEDGRLNSAGLGHVMPDGWDKVDSLARYKALGIELVENAELRIRKGKTIDRDV